MVEEVSPKEVKEQLDEQNDIQVIDIRDEEDFGEGHIPGAENVPMSDLPDRADEIEWGDDIVVACVIGQTSIQAARLIGSQDGVENGEAVRSMAGGYDAWEYELESEGIEGETNDQT